MASSISAICQPGPTVIPQPVDILSPDTARLNGSVIPNGKQSQTFFEWGLTASYGNTTLFTNIGSGAVPVPTSFILTNLVPNAEYHFRLTARNVDGTNSTPDATFQLLTPFTSANLNLPGIANGVALWGDYDADGLFDLLLSGTTNPTNDPPITVLYKNLGGGSFSNVNLGLPGLEFSAAAWGDYDNDNRLDLLICGSTRSGYVSRVYHNNGDSTFTDLNLGLPGVAYGAVSWIDFNNDGKRDFLLSGTTNGLPSGAICQLYRNNGNNTFTLVNAGLAGVMQSSLASLNFNGDFFPDVILAGLATNGIAVTRIYTNGGNGTFAVSITLPGISQGSIAVGDYNVDLQPDLLLTGLATNNIPITRVYTNNGGIFTDINAALPGLYKSSAKWIDWDFNHWLDFSVSGLDASGTPRLLLYRSEFGTNFSNVPLGIDGLSAGSLIWADYDRRGSVDPLVAGFNSNGVPTTIEFQNVYPATTYMRPAPYTVYAEVFSNQVTLFWSLTSDNANYTNKKSLRANLRVGTTPGGSEVVSAQVSSNGVPLLTEPQYNPLYYSPLNSGSFTWTFTNLQPANLIYYWSVQIIDANQLASEFAEELRFFLGAPLIATLPATNITTTSAMPLWSANACGLFTGAFVDLGTTTNYDQTFFKSVYGSSPTRPWSFDLVTLTSPITNLNPGTTYHYRAWATNALGTNYGADKTFITLANDPPVFLPPTVATGAATNIGDAVATLNGAVTPQGTETAVRFEYGPSPAYGLATEWTSVGSGTTPVPVTSLLSNLGVGLTYHFHVVATNISGSGAGSDQSFQLTSNPFQPVRTGLPGAQLGAFTFADFNNDGWVDIAVVGAGPAKIFRNNRDGTFTDIQAGLGTPPQLGRIEWGDYNNDGKPDILLASGGACRIYHNNGNETFTEVSVGLPNLNQGVPVWIDFDNDGLLDVVTFSSQQSKLYRNTGTNNFVDTGLSFVKLFVNSATITVGDYDNDGYQDIATIPSLQSSPYRRFYHNNRNGTFQELLTGSFFEDPTIPLSFGDIDLDGYLDIMARPAHKNQGDGTFLPYFGLPSNVSYRAVMGDYDRDGLLDVLLSAFSPTPPVSSLYKNAGGPNFTPINVALPSVGSPTVGMADLNNDGMLDLLLGGTYGAGASTFVYTNMLSPTNTVPAGRVPPTPIGLSVTRGNNSATFRWYPGLDQLGNFNAVTYNLRIGTTPGGCEILSPLSDSSGNRQVAAFGNIGQATSWTITNFNANRFYWTVQTINNAFVGSPFAPEESFITDGLPTATTGFATTIDTANATLNGTVSANGSSGGSWLEWTTNNIFSNSTVPQSFGGSAVNMSVSTILTDLPAGMNFRFRLVATNSYGTNIGLIRTFRTLPFPPTIVVQPVTALRANSAVLNTTVNPNNSQATVLFEYGLTAGYGSNTTSINLSGGSIDIAISSLLTNLPPATTFHYRVVAVNDGGTNSSPDQTFVTTSEPNVTSLPATDVSVFSATLNGVVIPNGQDTLAYFEYGPTTSYGTKVPFPIGSGFSAVYLSNQLSGLPQDSSFNYRIAATNNAGLILGSNQSFSLLPPLIQTNIGPFISTDTGGAWGDFNNDGYLDLLLSAPSGGQGGVSRLFRNLQNGSFSIEYFAVPFAAKGTADWGDFNNDGWLDFLVTEYTNGLSSGPRTSLYRNNRDGGFTIIPTGLPNVGAGTVAWTDFNNDGRLDLLLVGSTNGVQANSSTWIFENRGNGQFTDSNTSLTKFRSGAAIAVADFDKDGRTDIAISGLLSSTGARALVVSRNLGNWNFIPVTGPFIGVDQSSMAWIDYDGDGWLDLVVTGTSGVSALTAVYHNLHDGNFAGISSTLPSMANGCVSTVDFNNDGQLDLHFTAVSGAPLYRHDGSGQFASIRSGQNQIAPGTVTWGDFNNDGRMDAVIAGRLFPNGNSFGGVYINIYPATNRPPSTPTTLTSTIAGKSITFNWTAGSDVETPANALTYNLRVGLTPGGNEIVTSMSASNGWRRLPRPGNVGQVLSWTLTNVLAGTYYWSVQTIDSAMAGSPFASEQTVIIERPRIDVVQKLPADQFKIGFSGRSDLNYSVLTSSNLINWIYLGTPLSNAPGRFEFTDPAATLPNRYYIIRQE